MVNNLSKNHQWIVVHPFHHNRDSFICAQYKCHFQLPLCGLSSDNKCFENLNLCQSFSIHLPIILKLVSISSNYQISQTFYNCKLVSILHSFKIVRPLQLFIMQIGPLIQIEIQFSTRQNICTQKTWSLQWCIIQAQFVVISWKKNINTFLMYISNLLWTIFKLKAIVLSSCQSRK